MTGALLAHDRQHRSGNVHRADEGYFELASILVRGQLLEVAPIEVRGIIDEYVDRSEPVQRSLDSGLRLNG